VSWIANGKSIWRDLARNANIFKFWDKIVVTCLSIHVTTIFSQNLKIFAFLAKSLLPEFKDKEAGCI